MIAGGEGVPLGFVVRLLVGVDGSECRDEFSHCSLLLYEHLITIQRLGSHFLLLVLMMVLRRSRRPVQTAVLEGRIVGRRRMGRPWTYTAQRGSVVMVPGCQKVVLSSSCNTYLEQLL